jgi:hypothetical protein
VARGEFWRVLEALAADAALAHIMALVTMRLRACHMHVDAAQASARGGGVSVRRDNGPPAAVAPSLAVAVTAAYPAATPVCACASTHVQPLRLRRRQLSASAAALAAVCACEAHPLWRALRAHPVSVSVAAPSAFSFSSSSGSSSGSGSGLLLWLRLRAASSAYAPDVFSGGRSCACLGAHSRVSRVYHFPT